MDLSFSPNSQTLISTISLSQFHLPAATSWGCGSSHQSSPSLLRSRNRAKRLGILRNQPPPRCLLRDSAAYESSMLVVAAAFATVAALQLVHMNYSRRTRSADPEFTDKQESDICELRKQNMDIVEQEAVEIQLLSSESISAQSLQSDTDFEGTHENMGVKKIHAPSIKDNKQLELQTVVSSLEEILSNEERPNHEILTFVDTNNTLLKTTGAEGLISPSIETTDPVDFTAKTPEFM